MSISGKILVIDDEYGIRAGVREILCMESFAVAEAEFGRDALAMLEREDYDVVLIDYRLPDIDGLTLLRSIRARRPEAMTCMITAYANIETAVAATREGIDFFLPKPFSPEDLISVVQNLLRRKEVQAEAARLREAHRLSLAELATERSQTRSLVACLRDAVLVVNREGRVALINDAMAQLLGNDAKELTGRDLAACLPGAVFENVREALVSETERQFEITIAGREHVATVSGFASERNEALGRILTLNDISDVRRMAMEKARFIRTMIHEVRAPLGAIRAQVELAIDGSLGEERKAYLPFLERAEKRIDGLAGMIGDLLALARADAETAAAPADPVGLTEIVREVIESYRERAAQREVTCEMEMCEGLKIRMAPDALRTVMVNLVTNAIKYNREGGRVRVSATCVDGTVRVAVRDSGLGIKKDNLPRLFEEFFREKRKETRDIEGNGLGLSIVKRLVEKAHGQIMVDSEEGAWTEFTLHFKAAV